MMWVCDYWVLRFCEQRESSTVWRWRSTLPVRWGQGAYRFQVDGVRVDRPCSMDCGAVPFCLYTFTGARTQTHTCTETHAQTPTQVQHGGGDRDVGCRFRPQCSLSSVVRRFSSCAFRTHFQDKRSENGLISTYFFPPGRKVRKKTRKSLVVPVVPSF